MSRSSAARVGVGLGCIALLLLGTNLVLVWNIDAPAAMGDPPAATLWLAGLAGAPLVGMIIVGRRPENRYGWLLLSFGVTSGLLEASELYALFALEAYGEAGVGGVIGALVSQTLWGVTMGHIPLLLLLFPDGHLPGPRWRWLLRGVVALTIAGSTVALFIPGPLGVVPIPNPIGAGGSMAIAVNVVLYTGIGGIFLGTIPAAASLFVRRGSADPLQRLQLRWFSWAAAVLAAALLISAFAIDSDFAANAVLMVALAALFGSIGVAVTRYRLYEIDRVVSRTVTYALLTLVLGTIYVGGVTVLSTLTSSVADESPLAVAAATLTAAAVFGPARRRIQAGVDRQFNRRRYDARRTVEDYRRRLRDEVDLAAVSASLRATVHATVQPSASALWLRESP